jgi:glutamate racemase
LWSIISAFMETVTYNMIVPNSGAAATGTAQAPTVGVFDSGVGGFTVAREIIKLRPELNLVYFGDNLNVPYGGRQPEQIRRFAIHSIEFLMQHQVDILAVGCNASNSVLGQGDLRGFGLNVYDLVTSTIDWLRTSYGRPEKIALVATVATVNSRYWERKLCEAFPELELMPVAAPEFVPLIEAQTFNEKAARAAVERTVAPILESGVRTILHGCTHYPLLQPYMAELSPELNFIDPAACLAQRLAAGIAPVDSESLQQGKLRFFSSLPTEAFYRVGEQAFGRSIRELTSMYIVNPYEDQDGTY